MSTNEVLLLISIILSTIISTTSIIVVVLTLRQNNKMIESTTRPYITIYTDFTNFQTPRQYLILKNFGNSGAIITSFKSNKNLNDYVTDSVPKDMEGKDRTPFASIEGATIAPKQLIRTVFDPTKINAKNGDVVIDIEYKSENKIYSEKVYLKLNIFQGILTNRASTKGNELGIVSYVLQDIAEKLL